MPIRSFILLLLLTSLHAFSQTSLQGTVYDAKKKTPLPFCGVSIKGSRQSCITNADGVFQIMADLQSDSLVFSFLGYKKKTVAASAVARNERVFLTGIEIVFDEVVIHADDDYLYDIMLKCRKQMNASPSDVSKVYFSLETEYDHQAVEMLECYNNCRLRGNVIEDLRLKNGRIGLALNRDSAYFASLNTSRAISYLNLSGKNEYMPTLPFQFSKSGMKKNFSLKMLSVYEAGTPVYHIGFAPRKSEGKAFSGEVWIDKTTYAILKIDLKGEQLSQHPFVSLWPSATVDSVCMNVNMTYTMEAGHSMLSTLSFNYSLLFRKMAFEREVKTSGMMYFYDFGDPFILPYFEYDLSQSDYRKITFFPYNEAFWKNSKGLIYTEKQRLILNFLREHGNLVNYASVTDKDIPLNSFVRHHKRFFEDNYVFWSDTNRVSVKKNHLNKDSLAAFNIDRLKVKADLYHFKARIFLDINPVGDTLQWFSATVFDVYESFYKLPESLSTNCFLNLYFDLCEIERRKMESRLRIIAHPDKAQIDAIYQQTLSAIDIQTALYLKKVQSGDNLKELKIWNDRVRDELGVDNFKVFGL